MKILFVSLCFLGFISALAQDRLQTDPNAIGYHFDIEGNLIYGFLYNDYHPEEYLRINIDPYHNYYSGVVVLKDISLTGLISLSNNGKHIYFRENVDSKKKKIKKSELLYYELLGRRYPTVNTSVKDEALVAKFGNWRFYELWVHNPLNSGSYELPGTKNTVRYVVRNDSTSIEHTFKKGFMGNSRFHKDIQEIFTDFPKTINLIVEKKFTPYSFRGLADLLQLEYLNRHDAMASTNLQLKIDSNYSYYILKVDSIVDFDYHISYYRPDSTLALRRVLKADKNMLSELKFKKTHYHYDLDGMLKAEYFFTEDVLDSMKTYHHNGQLFEFITKQKGNLHWEMVFDSSSKPILDNEGNGELFHFDPINQRRLKNIYHDHDLSAVYYLDSIENKIFLFTEQAADYKFFSKFSQSIKQELKEFVIKDIDLDNLQSGYLLMELMIDEEGEVSSIQIRRGVVPGMDEFLLKTLKKQLDEKREFTEAFFKKEKVKQSVLVPFYINVYYPSNTRL